ncbi:alpha/beta fold hydrolase [Streptomyces sp. SID3343]|uniref:alpha/beta fold hydrolase n=1 Tax=Streptomyces sp. SID3343 TaxID=2690260 RepID=UPI00136F5929|nr:alpha/beta fold hydrolase [Streptomyces sp. SID3343]MYW03019.1 alpha/beta fold hydrolase [Streptomyces sp. SID3343]
MHAVRTGSGRPLLLVHGLGPGHGTWAPIVPALAARHEVVAVDLPGFGDTPPLSGPVTIANLADALERFIAAEGLGGVPLVGSSMGGRIVLELARRGHTGTTVALAPDGFWTPGGLKAFNVSMRACAALARMLHPALPAIVARSAGRTALMSRFSACPWKLPADLVLAELRGFETSRGFDAALAAMVRGPQQAGVRLGALDARVLIGWGRRDRVTPPSQAGRALSRFPDATLHWIERCGHYPHWDQPHQTAALIRNAVDARVRG